MDCKVIAVPLNFEENIKVLEDLSKEYKTSTGVDAILRDRTMYLSQSEDYDYKNSRWVIFLCNLQNPYLCSTPYSVWCKNYLERKGV